MTRRWWLAVLLCGFWAVQGHAYVQMTTDADRPLRWSARTVTVNPQVGCSGTCFDAAVRSAAEEWNQAGARFTFRVQTGRSVPVACRERDIDGRITVVWGTTICGDPWDGEVLAITNSWFLSDGSLDDADIIFNNADYQWSVYDGPAQFSTEDFRRTALHELGHALGLDHPDDYGQTVDAIMNAHADDLDRLQVDDKQGAQATYGRNQQDVPRTKGNLENPGSGATKTGIGIISGWVCDASRVEVEVGGSRLAVVYGTDRGDTISECGDANNGFVVLVNWNNFGDGVHRIRLLTDGRELVNRTVTVKTYGTDFLRGQEGDWWILSDFPTPGVDTIVGWTESLQNFEIVDIIRPGQ